MNYGASIWQTYSVIGQDHKYYNGACSTVDWVKKSKFEIRYTECL